MNYTVPSLSKCPPEGQLAPLLWSSYVEKGADEPFTEKADDMTPGWT